MKIMSIAFFVMLWLHYIAIILDLVSLDKQIPAVLALGFAGLILAINGKGE